MNTDKYEFKAGQAAAQSGPRTSQYLGKRPKRALLLGAFLMSVALVCWQIWSRLANEGDGRWVVWLSILLAAAGTIATQTQHLPAQNVLLAAAVIVLAGLVGGMFDRLASVELLEQANPYGGGAAGFGLTFWATPLMWTIMILNSRGAAKLSLARWRNNPNYGFWVLSSTAFLVMSLELSALATSRRTAEQLTQVVSGRSLAPAGHVLLWVAITLATRAVVTPILINKSAVDRPRTAQPLIIWPAINSLLLSCAALNGVWWAAGLLGAEVVLVLICAMRNQNNFKSQ